MKKKIAVFHTGGTISMKKDEDGGVNLQKDNPLAKSLVSEVEPVQQQIFGVASAQMSEQTMITLRNEIVKVIAQENADGVVVTHGTDTLEETAFFLDITVPHTVPVVVTGAMRSSDDLGSDALYNYKCAINVAAMGDEVKHAGTMVVLNGEIHAARSVTKAHTTNLAAFKSPDAGPIGFMTAQGIVFDRLPAPGKQYDVDKITKSVMLVKSFAGINSLFFDALDALGEKQGKFPIDGLVIEAFGAGNVPQRIVPCLQKLEQRGIPIVLASRCFGGMVQEIYDYSGGGKSLKTREVPSIIFSNGLNGPKSRLKLLVLLETTSDIKEIQAGFAV